VRPKKERVVKNEEIGGVSPENITALLAEQAGSRFKKVLQENCSDEELEKLISDAIHYNAVALFKGAFSSLEESFLDSIYHEGKRNAAPHNWCT
jgi:hypothetical protein